MEEFPSIRILQYTSEHITPDMWGREHVALITPPTPLAALTAPVVIVNTGLASHDLEEILEGYFLMEGCLTFVEAEASSDGCCYKVNHSFTKIKSLSF